MSGDSRHHTDAPPSSSSQSNTESSHNLLGGIWNHVKDAKDVVVNKATDLGHQAKEYSQRPDVQEKIHKGTAVATQMGTEVVRGVANDGRGVQNDVKHGNYAGAAERALPLVVGGPAGLIAKEVAPKVLQAGMHQLPAETQRSIGNSTVGRVATQAIGHGDIPTSATDVVRIATQHAKTEAMHQLIDAGKAKIGQHSGQGGDTQQREAAITASPTTQTPTSWLSRIAPLAGTKH
jgi:hypothetical protein